MRYSIFITGVVLAIALSQARAEPPGTGRAAPCQAAQLAAILTAAGGNAPQQQESLLVLRNTGETVCLLPPLPAITLHDADHRPLKAGRRAPPGMFPGPVLLPVTVQPGGGAAVRLRWSASRGGGGGRCISPDFIMLHLPGGAVGAPFHGAMCVPEGAGGWFYQAPLRGWNDRPF